MMRRYFSNLMLSVLALFAFATVMEAQAAFPRMTTVNPTKAKIGEVLTVEGENLEKSNVAELFLTDGKNDYKMDIVEQTPKTIRFKVADKCKPGHFALMILTPGKEPKLIEQPVKVNIE